MTLQIRWSKNNGSFQRCDRLRCSLVYLSVERQRNVEPRTVVVRHALVESTALEIEVGEIGLTLESTVHYDHRPDEFWRRRHAGVQHCKQ